MTGEYEWCCLVIDQSSASARVVEARCLAEGNQNVIQRRAVPSRRDSRYATSSGAGDE